MLLGLLAFAYYVGVAVHYGPTLDSDDYGFIMSAHRALTTGEFVTTIDLKPLHVFLGMLVYLFPTIAFEIVVASLGGLLVYFVWCWTVREAGMEAAALAAGWVAASPSLLFLVLSGNTVVTFSALMMGSIYYATTRPAPKIRASIVAALLLAVAGTARVEAWFLAVPLLGYWLLNANAGQRWRLTAVCALALLGPAVWALFGWTVAGNPLHYYGTNVAYATFAQSSPKSPTQYLAWLAQQTYLMVSTPIPLLAVLGLIVKRRLVREAHPIVTFPVLIVLLFAIASGRGFALQFRFVFFPIVALSIFAAIGTAAALKSAVASSPLQRWAFVCSLGVLVGACVYWLDPRLTRLPSGSYKAWLYYFDKEAHVQGVTRKVARALREMCGAKATTILVPARRLAQIRLELGPQSAHRFVTYRQLIAQKRSLIEANVKWVVYVPADFLNSRHAKRFSFLADSARARKAGIEILQAVRFGDDALILGIGAVRNAPDARVSRPR